MSYQETASETTPAPANGDPSGGPHWVPGRYNLYDDDPGAPILPPDIFGSPPPTEQPEYPPHVLANRTTFPPLVAVPLQGPALFSTTENPQREQTPYFDSTSLAPIRHYCFLATIVGFEAETDNHILYVKDRDGQRAMVIFPHLRSDRIRFGARPGRTIAIMDPLVHETLEGKLGIEVAGRVVVKVKVCRPLTALSTTMFTADESSGLQKSLCRPSQG